MNEVCSRHMNTVFGRRPWTPSSRRTDQDWRIARVTASCARVRRRRTTHTAKGNTVLSIISDLFLLVHSPCDKYWLLSKVLHYYFGGWLETMREIKNDKMRKRNLNFSCMLVHILVFNWIMQSPSSWLHRLVVT